MHPPRLNRNARTLAAAVAVLAATGVAFLIAQGNTPAHKVVIAHTTTPAPVTTTATTPTTTPVKPPLNNFTVAYYGNTRTRTRDFRAIPALHPPFKLAWAFGGNALLEFPPTIWGNNLYLIDDGATVKRVNITTGRQIWLRHEFSGQSFFNCLPASDSPRMIESYPIDPASWRLHRGDASPSFQGPRTRLVHAFRREVRAARC